jgi:hypothetical protein
MSSEAERHGKPILRLSIRELLRPFATATVAKTKIREIFNVCHCYCGQNRDLQDLQRLPTATAAKTEICEIFNAC